MLVVGLDWGDKRHAVCVLDEEGEVQLEREVIHSGRALDEMADQIRTLASGRRVAVGIERPRGVIVDILKDQEFEVFAINPRQVDAHRIGLTNSDAKDDRRDAWVIADALRTKPRLFNQVSDDREIHDGLRTILHVRQDLVERNAAALNQLRSPLRTAAPHLSKLVSFDALWGQRLLAKVALSKKPWRMQFRTIQAAIRGARKVEVADIQAALRLDQATMETLSWKSGALVVRLALKRLELFREQIRQVDAEVARQIDAWLETAEEDVQEKVAIIRSMPAGGGQLAAALIAYAWGSIEDGDRETLRCLGGIAPVTRQTGGRGKPKRHEVGWRRGCNLQLRRVLHNWGFAAAKVDSRAKARLAELRKRGHTIGRAVRQLVDGLLRVLLSCLRAGETYQPRPEVA